MDRSASATIGKKIDLYFEHHVLGKFDPSDIVWWFSLSGGKDSFAMAKAVEAWYSKTGFNYHALGFHINQWGATPRTNQYAGLNLQQFIEFDGRDLTSAATNYQPGMQAPCRPCGDVRKDVSDIIIERYSSDFSAEKIHFVCRGLHLSDMAVSILWRHAMGIHPIGDMLRTNKGHPLAKISPNHFVAKPLSYVREFEAQQYALEHMFIPSCCGCPACKFPSRRDIIEESLLSFFQGDTWEFDVPFVSDFLDTHANDGFATSVHAASLPGLAIKSPHLPKDFDAFVEADYRRASATADVALANQNSNQATFIEDYAEQQLKSAQIIERPTILRSKILDGQPLSKQQRMAAMALGPLWGANWLDHNSKKSYAQLQDKVFGVKTDKLLSHVNEYLNRFYEDKKCSSQQNKKQSCFGCS